MNRRDIRATTISWRFPPTGRSQPVREFEPSADLFRLADWLTECRVETVAMESTGDLPLFLEERGFGSHSTCC